MRKTILNLATLGLALAPAAWGVAVPLADTTTKLDVGGVMQLRGEHNWAEDSKGATFDVNRGKVGVADPVDFYNRRARLTVSAEREGWKGLISLAADNGDVTGNKKDRGVSLVYLWAEKTLKTGPLSHVIHAGLDQPEVQPAFRDPSSQLLFPVPRATVAYPTASIAYGVRYLLKHKLFQISMDVQNNRDTGRVINRESDGLFYGARAVVSLLPGVDLPKRTESFAGEKGMALALGLDGTFDHSYVKVEGKDTVTANYLSGGADLLFHWDALTADADVRFQKYLPPKNQVLSYAVSVQVGYAIAVPAYGIVVEPALRGSIIDKNIDDREATVTVFSSTAEAEHGNSGYEGEAGVNIYFNGHKNKLQIGFQRWNAETSNANANILRVQHQFTF